MMRSRLSLGFVFLIFVYTSDGLEPNWQCLRLDCDYKIIERLVRLEVSRDEQQQTVKELQDANEAKSQVIEEMKQQIQLLNVTKPIVALKVRLREKVTINVGQRIVYDAVVTDLGNAFVAASGSFRAPSTGTYLFSVTACSDSNDWGVLNIVNDGNIIGQVRTGNDGGYYDCNSEVTVRHTEKGSSVWIERAEGGKGVQNTFHWNSFMAVLVN